MSDAWCNHEGDAVLLVEGLNDCHVILALCRSHNVPQTFGIYQCKSDVNILKRANALISSPTPPRVLGLVIDADGPDLAGRWSSIKNKLSGSGFNLPQDPMVDGTILSASGELPRLGIWLMPNNRVDGMLEDFCTAMIDPNAFPTIEQCLSTAEANGCTTFKAAHRSKAFVHTYLAWQDEPGRPLGQAITAQSLRPDTLTARTFVKWLSDLFAE